MLKSVPTSPGLVSRERAQIYLSEKTSLWKLKKGDLLQIQILVGWGSEWGAIEVPREAMPTGVHRKKSRRIVDFRTIDRISDDVMCAILRLCLYRYLHPIGNTTRPCSLTTLLLTARKLREIARIALNSPARSDGKLWARLSLDAIYSRFPRTSRQDIGQLFRTAKLVGGADDIPDLTPANLVIDSEPEPERRGELPTTVVEKRQPFVHLPDAFVSQCGWRTVWLIKNMGPAILAALEHVYDVCTYRQNITYGVAVDQFRKQAAEVINAYNWSAAEFDLTFPFAFGLTTQRGRQRGAPATQFTWPPQTLADLWQCATVLQGAHAFVVGLSGGPRESELLSLTQGALEPSTSGWRIKGRTYKLVYQQEGQAREWPAPEFTVVAVHQQVRLARLAQTARAVYGLQDSGNHLWVLMPVGGHAKVGLPLDSVENALRKIAVATNTHHLLEGESSRQRNFHCHRLRKTTARILGLAINNSLELLQDLFGHRDLDMTMTYLLSNQDLAEEACEIARIETILSASSAVENAHSCGGGAAKKVQAAVREFAKRRGVDRIDAASAAELAADLTINGDFWEYVLPGVICVKLPHEAGACTRRVGGADPSRCSTRCDHRLELPALRRDTDELIAELLVNYREAARHEDELMQSMWRRQIKENVARFPDLLEKWSAEPEVHEMLGAQDGR